MKTYIYTYENDSVKVYRVKDNTPEPLHNERVTVCIHDEHTTVCQVITQFEKLKFTAKELAEVGPTLVSVSPDKTSISVKSGASYNPVSWRIRQGKINLWRV